ncbi:hypothetical protein FGB62_5g036 [Gracilaria domingensis]|nr:hypothetical protein FGB62_5g036 [Gracilaria domingensis]
MLFAPRSALYDRFPSLESFSSGPLDSLFIAASKNKSKATYVEVHLNHRARVFLLLNARGLNGKHLRQLESVEGLSTNWTGLFALRSSSGKSIRVGDSERTGKNLTLPSHAAVVETVVEKDVPLLLPHPGSVKVNGLPCIRMTLVFANTTENGSIEAFEYPGVPVTVWSPFNGDIVDAVEVKANEKCPDWLHDLHVIETRDKAIAKEMGEPLVWRTWHSPIDSIYWCYYDHEHGSYPGEYRPMFGYTAWKTADSATSHGRQDESHDGFKTFSFVLEEQKRVVVLVIHMHLSRGRRFVTRHHTSILAIMNENWELLIEFHMKQDFGAALATLRTGKTVAIDAHEDEILEELKMFGKRSGRRFNVLRVDDNFPDSVDRRFELNKDKISSRDREVVRRGIYEQWNGALNTCSWSKKRFTGGGNDQGIMVDIRNPATALIDTEQTPRHEAMQQLRGNSMDRFIKIKSDVEIGPRHCWFDIFSSESGIDVEMTGGVFYTDAYFRGVKKMAGRFYPRQYMRMTSILDVVVLKAGKLLVADGWNGHYSYENGKALGRRLVNTEGAVRAEVN